MSDDHDEAASRSPRGPATTSRIGVQGTRAAYVAGRRRYKARAQDQRKRRELPIGALLGSVIEARKLTDGVREQFIAIAWRQIVGEHFAKASAPGSFSRGVLTVWTRHPVWTQELRYSSAAIIERVNSWITAREAWLGARPRVTELRLTYGAPRRPLADPDDLRRLQQRYRRVLRVATPLPSPPTDAEREAILVETRVVEDSELREAIERLRTTWNC